MAEGIPDYDELKLRIQPGTEERTYQLLVFGPGGATASASFRPPFSDLELENFILKVGPTRRTARTYRSPQMDAAKKFGSGLSAALLSGEVRDVYLGARRRADENNRGLRVTLYLTNVPELMEVPWEFLYEQRPSGGSFLSQNIYTPIVRSLDLPSAQPPRTLTRRLRILGLVSSPAGFPALDVDGEKEKLEEAVSSLRAQGRVDLTWIEPGTMAELERVIGAPEEEHVVHYIGHGAYDESTESGVLVFENAQGGDHYVTGEDLCTILANERSLRLAVLNSCEGARGGRFDPFSGVASSLVGCGIPAVIGMQFEITDEAAKTFSERLYTALAQGYPVDAALTRARLAIFATGNDIEFGTPVLFLRGADTKLFDVEENGDGGESDFSVRLEQPPSGEADAELTRRLTITNTGARPLSDIRCKKGDGKPLADPIELLEVGGRHSISWKETIEAADRLLITVSASDPEGKRISEQVIATDERIVRVPPPPPPWWRTRAIVVAIVGAIAAAAIVIVLLVRDGDDGDGVSPDTISVGDMPVGISSGDGSVWTANRGGSVSMVDPETDHAETIDLEGVAPEGVSVGGGSVWVTDGSGDTVTRLSSADGLPQGRPVQVGSAPADLAVASGSVWVANQDDNSVSRIDLENPGEVDPIDLEQSGPYGVTFGQGDVWVTNRDSDSVSRIDGDTAVVKDTTLVGDNPKGIAVTDEAVWVANAGDGTVSRVAFATEDEEKIKVGGEPRGVVAFSGSIWVADGARDAVIQLDEKGNEIQTIAVGAGPEGITVAPEAETVWVANGEADTVTEITITGPGP
jgi:YVTN family beta-propeller protein